MSMCDDVSAEAKRLGFLFAGVTPAMPVPDYDLYSDWLMDGNHADMAYLSNEKGRQCRENPALLLPGCRSIITLGANYPNPASFPPLKDGFLRGQISTYAWLDDYHLIIPPMIEQLAQAVRRIVGRSFNWRGFCDNVPLLERSFAHQAGLGWIGKNSCLINPQAGSHFFLAEVLLDIDLPIDENILPDRCGTCRRCIEACPTGCILDTRTIDSRRCISYLTIENKGDIPENLRPLLGNRIFGCDDCQSVCPWNNRPANHPILPAFGNQTDFANPDLLNDAQLSPDGFAKKFRHSPVLRAKWRGYLRNIVVALGNFRQPEAIPVLKRLIEKGPDPLVLRHATWALEQITK